MKDTKLLPSQPLCNGYTYHHIKLLAKNSCQLSYEMKISNNYTLNYSKYCFCKKKKVKAYFTYSETNPLVVYSFNHTIMYIYHFF